MIRISSLILRGAITRKESRGAHYRLDYPLPDNKGWLVNIILQKSPQGIDHRLEKVRLVHMSPEES
jgi:succinate dehydrogenase/fumarate reductase flavoprotein subunit